MSPPLYQMRKPQTLIRALSYEGSRVVLSQKNKVYMENGLVEYSYQTLFEWCNEHEIPVIMFCGEGWLEFSSEHYALIFYLAFK